VPERLGEREERLTLGDVSPQVDRELVRRERAAGEPPEDSLLATVVEVEPLVHERPVALDGVAVPGQEQVDVELRRAPERVEVEGQRAHPLARVRRPVEGAVDDGVGGDVADQVVADDRQPLALDDEDRVGRAVARTLPDEQAPAARLDHVSLPERVVDRDGAAVDAVLAGDGVELRDRSLGDPVQPHHVGLVGVLELHLPREVGQKRAQELVCNDRRATPLAHGVGEPDVVVVLVREDHLLDVLHAEPARGERGLQLDDGLRPVGARVDQRQRVALEQIAVDRADGERHGQRDRGHRHPDQFSHMDYLPTIW